MGVYEYDSSRYISTYIGGDELNYKETMNVVNGSSIENSKEDFAFKNRFIGAHNPYSEYFGKLNAYLTIIGGKELSFTGDNKEFLGIGGENL